MINNNYTSFKIKQRPIPNLKDTSKTLGKFLKPFATQFKSQIEDTDKVLQKFLKNFGQELQKRLVEKNKAMTHWIYDFALDNYLSKRSFNPINSNRYLVIDFRFKDQIDAVARLIICAVLFKSLIKDEKIAQLTTKCPWQYYLLFHSVKQPKIPKDRLIVHSYGDNKYIIILYRNIFWMLEASLDYEAISDQISFITAMDLEEPKEKFMGMLTLLDRNTWALERENFCKISERNREFMYYLESSMMIFCLDMKTSSQLTVEELNHLAWFGDGQNRFFDKILQFIILKDGKCIINTDRFCLEQSLCLSLIKYVKEMITNNEVTKLNEVNDIQNHYENFPKKPSKLNYDLNHELQKKIVQAYHDFNNDIKPQLNCEFMIFEDFGKLTLEKKGLTCQAFIQLALLAAYYKVWGKIVSSRQHKCGRNFSFGIPEWIRTTTKEAANFTVVVNEPKVPRDLKVKLGMDAFKQFKNNLTEVKSGRSVDTHLLGLKSVMIPGEKEPLFEDYMIKKSTEWKLDIYPILHDIVQLSANPPPCEDGISVTYIVRKNQIQFICCGYKDLSKFNQALTETLMEMKDLFVDKRREYIRPKF